MSQSRQRVIKARELDDRLGENNALYQTVMQALAASKKP